MSKNTIESDFAIEELTLGLIFGETRAASKTNKARIIREAAS